MPNWCQGIMKLRGKKKNLLKFLLNGIEIYEFENGNLKTLPGKQFKATDWGEYIYSIDRSKHYHIMNTRRSFLEEDVNWYFDSTDEEDMEKEYIQCLDVKQAWAFSPENFLEIAKEYDLDIRIQGFECGMCFSQIMEIVDKKITKNEEITYENYEWEAYDPRLGG